MGSQRVVVHGLFQQVDGSKSPVVALPRGLGNGGIDDRPEVRGFGVFGVSDEPGGSQLEGGVLMQRIVTVAPAVGFFQGER